MKKKQLELLAPAGSYDIFRAVLNAGADAVYVGGGQFGARAYANNFPRKNCSVQLTKRIFMENNSILP